MTTNELTKETVRVLNLAGFTVWRANAGYIKSNVRLAPSGTPDIIGFGPKGRFVGIEVKTGRDSIRPAQMQWHKHASAEGAFVSVVKSTKDLDDVLTEYDASAVFTW